MIEQHFSSQMLLWNYIPSDGSTVLLDEIMRTNKPISVSSVSTRRKLLCLVFSYLIVPVPIFHSFIRLVYDLKKKHSHLNTFFRARILCEEIVA